jgi:predicted regulator of Ras-like GTPase activity (Roadblock/LC7/MglB family)
VSELASSPIKTAASANGGDERSEKHTRAHSGQLDWLLDEFVGATPGVVHGVVVSGDGLRLATSKRVSTALGDQLAAAASGLVSLASGTAHLLSAGPVTHTILEMAGGYLFVSSIGHGAVLAVFAGRQCDIGLVGYEMTVLASRVGHALTPAPRAARGG